MKHVLFALVFLMSTACVVHTHGRERRQAVQGGKRCHPSHYWDGKQCRHKGRGHGARKHDY